MSSDEHSQIPEAKDELLEDEVENSGIEEAEEVEQAPPTTRVRVDLD